MIGQGLKIVNKNQMDYQMLRKLLDYQMLKNMDLD